MSRKAKIFGIYSGVAVLAIGMIIFFNKVGSRMPDPDLPMVSDTGKEEVDVFFPVTADLELNNQLGEPLNFSDIEGEVTLVAQFFAVCPHCAVRNGAELKEIYERFGEDSDFRILCISVDPETDKQAELEAYAEALDADARNWLFAAAADKAETHEFLEKELKFFKIRERRDPVDIASNGRYAHDLAFLLVDRDLNVIGKWPLAEARSDEARSRDPDLYERLKLEMYERIQKELDKQ